MKLCLRGLIRSNLDINLIDAIVIHDLLALDQPAPTSPLAWLQVATGTV